MFMHGELLSDFKSSAWISLISNQTYYNPIFGMAQKTNTSLSPNKTRIHLICYQLLEIHPDRK